MPSQFLRTELLLGEKSTEILQNSTVAVFGIGGVGGYVVEALARSGIGKLVLIDADEISLSNINRQIIALHSTVGKSKVDIARQRVLDINPNIEVITRKEFYLPENAEKFDFAAYDYIADAIDTVAGKISLVEQAYKFNKPIICAMGAGNKLDPTKFQVADIAQTKVCPLAKVMRKELRKRGIEHFKVVYSEEPAIVPANCAEQTGKRQTPGSVAFVPSVMGLIMAGEIIKDLIQK